MSWRGVIAETRRDILSGLAGRVFRHGGPEERSRIRSLTEEEDRVEGKAARRETAALFLHGR